MFEALTGIGEDGTLEPVLAESWHFEDDTTWVFTIKDGIRFSNGEPFDAHAAAATINYLLTDEGRVFSVYREVRNVAQATARDRLTLEVKTTQPDSMIPGRLAGVRILPPKYFAEVGADAFALKPHGTGSFMVDRWETGRANLVKNPYAWRPAQIDAITYTAAPDSTARTQALLSGAVDIAYDLGATDVPRIEQAGARIDYRTRAAVQMWQFVTEVESPLQDKRVRQALNYATNIEVIVAALLQGVTVATGQVAARGTFGYDPGYQALPLRPSQGACLVVRSRLPGRFHDSVPGCLVERRGRISLYSSGPGLKTGRRSGRAHPSAVQQNRCKVFTVRPGTPWLSI